MVLITKTLGPKRLKQDLQISHLVFIEKDVISKFMSIASIILTSSLLSTLFKTNKTGTTKET